MTRDNRDLVIRAALSILPAHLEPYVRSTVRGLAPQEQRRLIEAVHITSPHVDTGDLATQIRILTARDDDGHYLLPLPPGLGGGLHEVRRLRDDAVLGRPFDPDATLAALVAVSEVLRRIGAADAVAEVRALITAIDDGQQAPGAHAQPGAGAQAPSAPIVLAQAETAPVISYAHAVAHLQPRVSLHLAHHTLLGADPAGQDAAPPDQGAPLITVSIIEEGEGNEVAGPIELDPAPQWQWEDGSQELSATTDLPLQRDRLLHVSQPCPSRIRVELRLPDGATQVRTLPGPTVLPVRQWTLEGPAHWSGASLATFVQPAQPALAALEATARHQGRTESETWGPEPADALVGAACAALRSQDLSIHAPEAPWSAAPQSIRSAEALMDTRRGTTLDLAVALAGLLERLEVPTLLLLTPACAMVGYWRDGQMPEPPPQDGEAVADLVERGLLGVVDPGLLMSSQPPALHLLPGDARAQATSTLREAALILWLGQARAQGADPQALLERDEDGVVHETEPESLAGPLSTTQAPPAVPQALGQPVSRSAGADHDADHDADQEAPEAPARVREWKQCLLDLTAHNPLIDRSRQQAIPLSLPPGLISDIERMVRAKDLVVLRPASGQDHEGERAQELAARLLIQERAIELDLSARDYGTRLRVLATKARTIVEDTGANNLYLAFGTMEWQIGGRRARSPLVLIPVTLHPFGGHYGLILDEAGESTPNYSFLARFAADTGIDLSDLVERLRPEREEDFLATLEEIRQRLSRAGRPEEVTPTVHLGLFQFSTYRMWKDLEDSWRPIADNPLVRYLIETQDPAQHPFIDPAQPDGAEGQEPAGIDEVVENLPLTADATQARVVADAVAGHSLVVEGPPGTGKSQTVANLIFRALAAGRTVMFVAEKRTALDVVARRLQDEAGIGDLVLNLHDNGMKSAQMRESLRRALELRAENIDLGGLEERRAAVRALRAQLEAYRSGLHDPGAQGRSLYEDYEARLAPATGSAGDTAGDRAGDTAGDRAGGSAEGGRDDDGRGPAEPVGPDGEPFDAERHSRLVEDYRQAVARLRELLPAELLHTVLAHRDRVLTRDTERTLALHREISRRKGSLSIREMMGAYADLITAITPCILVSPDSVARFFPAGRRYVDIIVFDEASQIPVADAVGAIGRGRSVVIAGDPKQMPPTSIVTSLGVQSVTHDDLVGVQAQEKDSILTQCLSARMRHYRLPWHYRSRVESLITFSNERYYDGALRSFPSPLAMAGGPDPAPGGHGITLRRVQGRYFRPADVQGGGEARGAAQGGPHGGARPQTNPQEAEQVVEEVLRRFEASPERAPSLGVITFNDKQRDLIEEMLRDRAPERIQEALEQRDGLLIKNLENVQGEERDTILFSVTFSPNSRGELPLTFGPLSREGGQRRLNVAITRARRQIIVFTSFDPEQLRAERSAHQGVKDLRAYLEQARDAGAPARPGAAGGAPDWYRHAIAEELRGAGLVVHEAVGQSSFAVDLVLAPADRPHEPTVAVVLDGRQWNGRGSAADRDIMPVDVLRTMGWPRVERIWAPQWAADKEAVITRLVQACRSAALQGSGGADGATGSGADGTPGAAGALSAPGVPEYRSWAPERALDPSVLERAQSEAGARNEVRRIARRICEVEAPLSRRRLVVQVCRAFGVPHPTAERQESVRQILGEAFAHIDEHDFVWLRQDQVHTAAPYRRGALDHLEAGIEEIHPRELVGAVEEVRATASAWTSREDLFLQVLQLLSTQRRPLTPRVWEALDAALAQAETADPE
ncbi:DUF4011 domain-containing protein [Actinomyces capricornis]|uniref:DNA helicase n=1 Tax=Actinomyces capricornis TaxID=2755559 RepID=A0ABM7UKZ5_9ACTO|nr:DUF4011 domain-containing protein [Actinomyces capricornis]BDA64478.1 hypothetical protein MANAM107_13120 [Actinomyces capricornis]